MLQSLTARALERFNKPTGHTLSNLMLASPADAFSPLELSNIVQAFEAGAKPVPLHLAEDGPASRQLIYGWAYRLEASGSFLYADFNDVLVHLLYARLGGTAFEIHGIEIDRNRNIGGRVWPCLLNCVVIQRVSQ